MVPDDGHLIAYCIQRADIKWAIIISGLIFKLTDYFSPWIDAQAVAPGLATI